MKKLTTTLAMTLLASTSLSAQSGEQPAVAVEESAEMAADADTAVEAVPAAMSATPVAPAKSLTLREGTPIKLSVTSEVNSSTHDEGDTFALSLAEDVVIDGVTVIPRGTPASAEITWRTGKGAFGKSGKLEFGLRNLDLDGTKIPVSGTFRQEGEGNTVATGVGILAVGVFAGFITGKRARVPAGRELTGQIAQPVPFTANGALADSFDSDAAVTAAAMSTEFGRCKMEANALESDRKRKKAMKDCYSKRME